MLPQQQPSQLPLTPPSQIHSPSIINQCHNQQHKEDSKSIMPSNDFNLNIRPTSSQQQQQQQQQQFISPISPSSSSLSTTATTVNSINNNYKSNTNNTNNNKKFHSTNHQQQQQSSNNRQTIINRQQQQQHLNNNNNRKQPNSFHNNNNQQNNQQNNNKLITLGNHNHNSNNSNNVISSSLSTSDLIDLELHAQFNDFVDKNFDLFRSMLTKLEKKPQIQDMDARSVLVCIQPLEFDKSLVLLQNEHQHQHHQQPQHQLLSSEHDFMMISKFFQSPDLVKKLQNLNFTFELSCDNLNNLIKVFSSDATEIIVKDLKPNTKYFLR